MPYPYQPWRAAYQPASYGGAGFHVEVDSQLGGRRNALHEFPHRDVPWAEDMGRKARHWTVVGYVIGPTYTADADALVAACEVEGPRTLVHPLMGSVQANCDDYVRTERRELGGYAVVEMRFVESGSQPGLVVTADTQSQVTSAAENSDAAASNSFSGTVSGAPAPAATPASVLGVGGTSNAGFGTVPSSGFAGQPLTSATGF